MIALPWSCVTALKLEPVGPISAGCFGLRYLGSGWGEDREDGMWQSAARFTIVDPVLVRMTRDTLGTLVYDQRMTKLHPNYVALCAIQRGLYE